MIEWANHCARVNTALIIWRNWGVQPLTHAHAPYLPLQHKHFVFIQTPVTSLLRSNTSILQVATEIPSFIKLLSFWWRIWSRVLHNLMSYCWTSQCNRVKSHTSSPSCGVYYAANSGTHRMYIARQTCDCERYVSLWLSGLDSYEHTQPSMHSTPLTPSSSPHT